MKAKMPKPIMNYIGKAALKQATSWVKKESEKKPEATIPKPFDASAFGLDELVEDKENIDPTPKKKSRVAFFSRN